MPSPSNHVQLCFGNVRHTRLRPVHHAFTYGVYYLRIPLRALGESNFDSHFFSRNKFNFLSFHDRDYGDGRQTPLAWIDATLKTEGIDDADGEIWLQTFPRVLGYVFNPVSFWFCHRLDGSLRAVLCEVRNTFGEQHSYLLDGKTQDGGSITFGTELRANKMFHVSPFCEVAGAYRFRFMRTQNQHETLLTERTTARIEYDDASGPLILTSVSGTAEPLLPLSDRLVARAFFRYPIMTVGVILRIHWQALKLWRKRVPFYSKPAPPSNEVSR
ncbi:DUF1365 domain-containing protein [Glaciimonas sp. CA11.2]|uniref:DUF1365 domain-containing protein n=1 Tax=unclassified Glaciimonas TaxID=2644401 RepID=UPI002AB45E27|nr:MULTISPECIES: DUF1365 domain-containing protein [unclassified Glaciimonas]MDY7546429.1 DUF1365 domain-containing protein [Glaciimonas sp. CA11.2]MEB0014099.1 DUF1365 domain-containing protein [Glaciimonas sp. Cout2]MEB0083431.1 DUF1365 domain-containing protein [Glaciimonas sp. Gout2]MEB0162552.1 DUF1365 domain-containing protein [Glaciimonas sp. CA11.2]